MLWVAIEADELPPELWVQRYCGTQRLFFAYCKWPAIWLLLAVAEHAASGAEHAASGAEIDAAG